MLKQVCGISDVCGIPLANAQVNYAFVFVLHMKFNHKKCEVIQIQHFDECGQRILCVCFVMSLKCLLGDLGHM